MEWYNATHPKCYRGGLKEINRYNRACEQRRSLYYSKEVKNKDIISDLQEKSYSIVKNCIDVEKLDKLMIEFDNVCSSGKNLKQNNSHFCTIDQPFLYCPTTTELATNNLVIDIATDFFNCLPAIGTFNFRRSYVNNLPINTTQLFHCDPNSVKFLKFFFYLNDVDMDGGPFTIVEGSHKFKFMGWDSPSKYRWNDEEIERLYGKESIRYLTANKGDMIVANTTAFHKGTKPTKTERTMLTLNYVMHPEDWKDPSFKIFQSDVDKMPDHLKPLTDFLVKV